MELAVWERLAEDRHEELVRAAMGVERGDLRGIASLRKMCADAEVVRAAMELGEARRRAVGKFGKERAAGLWADVAGVEMATSAVVAEHKRTRIPVFLDGFALTDVCCGIGGDAMAFAGENDVVAVDRDPVRAWMAARNAGCGSVVADAVGYVPGAGPVHIDPARRDGAGRRSRRVEDMSPGMDVVRRMVGSGMGGAVKLGPGVDLEEIERALPEGKIEIISENGSLVQCVVWMDMPFAGPEARRATLLRGSPDDSPEERAGCAVSIAGTGREPAPVVSDYARVRYVHEPDDSVERAGLLGVLCERVGAAMLHARVGLLASDAAISFPLLTSFEVLELMAWNEKRVKGVLEERGAGIVEVKTRGVEGIGVRADELAERLRGEGEERLVVFVVRCGDEVRGIVARRV